jgi:hypothetical protein
MVPEPVDAAVDAEKPASLEKTPEKYNLVTPAKALAV